MKSKILYIILGIVLLSISVGIFLYYNTSVYISVTPGNAKIILDNISIANSQKTKIKPGNYKLKINLEDYIPYESDLNISFGSNTSLNIVLRALPIPEKVVNDLGRFAVLSEDKKSMYFLSNNGKTMYQIQDIEAEKLKIEKISPDFFSNITNIIWSPDRELAIIKQTDKTSLYDFKRYDLLHQEITPFDDGVKNIVWSADAKNIIYYFSPVEGETTLIKATQTNTNLERIYNFKDTAIRNPQIDWSPDQGDILLVANKKLYLLNLYLKKLTELSIEGVLEAKFTPDNKIIYITDIGAHICDKLGQNAKKLDFNTSLNKITFLNKDKIIYVQKINDVDKFYYYNLLDNTKTELVYNHKYKINPVNEILSTNENYLYFESMGYLYRIKVDTSKY